MIAFFRESQEIIAFFPEKASMGREKANPGEEKKPIQGKEKANPGEEKSQSGEGKHGGKRNKHYQNNEEKL